MVWLQAFIWVLAHKEKPADAGIRDVSLTLTERVFSVFVLTSET